MSTESPSVQLSEIPPAMDYASHLRQFHRFLHLLKWFIVHMVFLLAALYFFLIGGQPVIGAVLLAIAVGTLGYGILSTPQIARDIGRALEDKPETS